MLGRAVVDQALIDPESTELSAKVKATLRLLTRVTKEHEALTADDIRPVLATGVTRQGVTDALMVAYAFNIITRLADAFEFEVPARRDFDKAADRLLSVGYRP